MKANKLLAQIAKEEALKCYHGFVMQTYSNIGTIIEPFPKWSLEEADGNWCAAFVYHCCIQSGMKIPVRPRECVSCNLAGCGAWEEWAIADDRIFYTQSFQDETIPQAGDIILFDSVFNGREHDHIGIVLENKENSLILAEGNINNLSGIIERKKDNHIRALIRIKERFSYVK